MNFGIVIVLAILAVWGLGVFLGVIGGFSKTFAHQQKGIDSSDLQTEEQKSIEDTKDRQQQYIQDMKDKMDESSKKY